jgi:nucleoside-diphosphate kinase
MREKTFFMIKPDGTKRKLEIEVAGYLRNAGLEIVKREEKFLKKEKAEDLYSPHKGKKFFQGLIKFITSGAVVGMVVEGEQAVSRLREIMGATDPGKALSGTIRGDLKEKNYINEDGIIKNIVHGSDSAETAEKEIEIFFD